MRKITLSSHYTFSDNLLRLICHSYFVFNDYNLTIYKYCNIPSVPGSRRVEGGDIVSRVLLRQRLKCQSFSWYLNEVFPEQHRPEKDFVAYGQVNLDYLF